MKYRFIRVPVSFSEDAEQELNRFLAGHRVSQVERRLIENGDASHWAFCIEYMDGSEPLPGGKATRIDYKEVLNESDFAAFARLRELRKEQAAAEGVPAYAIFTNEQLAEMVRRRVKTKAAMSEIEGIGKSRIEKYANTFLSQLAEQQGDA